MLVTSSTGPGAQEDIAKLLASPHADVGAVLQSASLVEHLQSVQSIPTARYTLDTLDDIDDERVRGFSSDISSSVRFSLQFIANHSETLFALLDGRASVVKGKIHLNCPSCSIEAPNGSLTPPKTQSELIPLSVEVSSNNRMSGESGVEDRSLQLPYLYGGLDGGPLGVDAALSSRIDSTTDMERYYLTNLTELLSFCITQSPNEADVTAIAGACTVALGSPKMVETPRTSAVQRLLLEAFDSDFKATTQAIADALTPSTIVGIIHNLSSNAVIAETLIAIFGSALSAVWMVKPTTKTALFTSRWIALEFPSKLCAFLPTAIRNPGMYNYFYFFKELLRRGYSHSAGPIVDVLLSDPLVSDFVEQVLQCCEESALQLSHNASVGTAAAPDSLAAEGMEVLVSIVSLVRKSMVLPENGAMYEAATHQIAPVAALQAHATRVVALLTVTSDVNIASLATCDQQPIHYGNESVSCSAPVASSAPPHALGPLRLAVCELFVEFSLFELAKLDRTLISSQFFPAFMRCCEQFPQHPALSRALHHCLITVFKRLVHQGESLRDAVERDCLWKYLVEPETILLRNGERTSVIGAVTRLAQIPGTTMSSHCIDILTTLSSLPLFQSSADGPFAEHLKGFMACEAIQERVRFMAEPITGELFEAAGSAQLVHPLHRETINLAGDRYHGSALGSFAGATQLLSVLQEAPTEPFVIVHHRADSNPPQRPTQDTVDMDVLKREMEALQRASSPAVQSYPSFSCIQLSIFGSTEYATHDEMSVAGAVMPDTDRASEA